MSSSHRQPPAGPGVTTTLQYIRCHVDLLKISKVDYFLRSIISHAGKILYNQHIFHPNCLSVANSLTCKAPSYPCPSTLLAAYPVDGQKMNLKPGNQQSGHRDLSKSWGQRLPKNFLEKWTEFDKFLPMKGLRHRELVNACPLKMLAISICWSI